MADSQDKPYVLVVAVLTAFAGALMLSAVVVALPAMGNELSMNAVELGWISQSFALAAAIFVLTFGRLADIWGRRRIFTIGLVLAIASTLLVALSNSFPMLVSLRVVQGIGITMTYSTGLALLISAYPPTERGKVLGINVTAISLGLSLGPTLGGILTQNLGWRSIFFLYLVLVAPALALLITRVTREWAEAKGEKFDIAGSILFSIMLFCIMYGFSLLPALLGIWIIAVGIISLAAFIAWELKVETPIFNIHLLSRNRLFAFSNLTQVIYYSAIFAIPFILSLYLQYIKGFSPQDTGLVLLAQPIMQAVFSPLAGRISDRIQPRITVSAGVVIVLVALLLLLSETKGMALVFIILSLGLIGSGHAFVTSPNTNAIMGSVEKRYYGVAASMDVTTRSTGMTFGMGIILLVFSLYMGTAQITPENYTAFVESIRVALLIFCGLCLLCILVSATRGKVTSLR